MPSSHRRYADWTLERIRAKPPRIGPSTVDAVRDDPGAIARTPNKASAPAWASCAWPRRFGADPARSGSLRALEIGARTYGSVRSILDNKLDSSRPRRAAPRRPRRPSSIPTSAAPATTTEEKTRAC